MPMDDLVEIGVFAPGEGDGFREPLYLQRHRIRSGGQAIRITVPRPAHAEGSGAIAPKLREGGEPARAGIDPSRTLIDRQGNDNVVGVEKDLEDLEFVGSRGSDGSLFRWPQIQWSKAEPPVNPRRILSAEMYARCLEHAR